MDTRHINLLTLIPGDFKRRGNSDGGEYAGPCPFCGGNDRFIVWPTPDTGNPRFWCRQCDAKGDAIEYLKLRDGKTFQEACDYLGLQASQLTFAKPPVCRRPALVSKEKPTAALSDPGWQQSAAQFCNAAADRLWSREGEKALAYLLGRKLTEPVIRAAHLGYNPVSHSDQWGRTKVWLYTGIVIPWLTDGVCWKVNIRRRPSDLKPTDKRYQQAAGGANGLYLADNLTAGCTVVVTEGEFDALSIYAQAATLVAANNVVAVATGSTQSAHNLRWVAALAKSDRMLLAFDNDKNGAGDKAAEWWLTIFQAKAQRLRPTGHDINDMARAGADLGQWIAAALSS